MFGSRDGLLTHAGVDAETGALGMLTCVVVGVTVVGLAVVGLADATLVAGALIPVEVGVLAAIYPLSTIEAAASICSRVDNGAPLANQE
jgi:hypothetical protein